jgi:hypothetical protein
VNPSEKLIIESFSMVIGALLNMRDNPMVLKIILSSKKWYSPALIFDKNPDLKSPFLINSNWLINCLIFIDF